MAKRYTQIARARAFAASDGEPPSAPGRPIYYQPPDPEVCFQRYLQEVELAEELGVHPIIIRFLNDWEGNNDDKPAVAASVLAIVNGESSPEEEARRAGPYEAHQKGRLNLLKAMARDLPKFVSLVENS